MRYCVLTLVSFTVCQVAAVPLQARRSPLDPVGSFLSSVFLPDATTTDTGPAAPATSTPAPTPTPADPKSKDPKDPKSTTTQQTLTPTVITITSTESSSTTSSTSTSSSSSTTTSTISSTTTSASPSITPAPTSPVNGAANSSQATASNNSGSGISPAGIAVAVIMSLAVLTAVFFVLWKFYGPIVRWREKREYEKMQERSYRPALDGAMQQDLREKALGRSGTKSNRASVMSFLALGRPKQSIKRKPVPVPPLPVSPSTAAGGTGVSPLIAQGPLQTTRHSRASSNVDKDLPSLPKDFRG